MNDAWELTAQAAAIVAGTLLSEDATCIAVGLLVRARQINPVLGVVGCLAGIYLGDLGLWMIGRLAGRRVLGWNLVRKRLSSDAIVRLRLSLQSRFSAVIFAARFLPGARVAVYVVSGALGCRPGQFLFWSLLAAMVWTPLLVLSVAIFGQVIIKPLSSVLHSAWWGSIAAAVLLYLLVQLVYATTSYERRARIVARISRLWRWEFWPTWLFYLPWIPWFCWLALRYRSWTVWTAANPGIPHGGVVGESKFDILSKLPPEWIIPTELIPSGNPPVRLASLLVAMMRCGWKFPLILKPDISQRGAGVKRVDSLDEAARYFTNFAGPLLAQPYHPGPFEAGIFYYRFPGESRGRIFSITDKQFAKVTGDGRSTLSQLVWRHPRLRMQADTFLTRHAAQRDRILFEGESFSLGIAGNHCQGTMFRDGSHLITPELESRIDQVAKHFSGFYFGRFDVRYSSVEEFCRGTELAIVELNGVTSESTNLYDPAHSLRQAYAILFRQWSLLFAVGNANRLRGIKPSTWKELLMRVREFRHSPAPQPLSD